MTISTLFLGFGLRGFDDIKSQSQSQSKALASMYVRVSGVTQAKQMQCLSFLVISLFRGLYSECEKKSK
jgi:hypothetical protein